MAFRRALKPKDSTHVQHYVTTQHIIHIITVIHMRASLETTGHSLPLMESVETYLGPETVF